MKKTNRLNYLFLSILIFTSPILARGGDGCSQDPMSKLNYRYAFNQAKIFKKYKQLLTAWGCDKNVFESTDSAAISDQQLDKEELKKIEKDFQKACLKKLHAARNWAVAEPAIEGLAFMTLVTASTVIIAKMISKESLGGSLAIGNSVFNSIFFLKDLIKLGYHLTFPQQSSLTSLEKQFALNQCFIPKAIWPVIIEKFMLARQNQFEQRKCMDFLEFTLGLTTYKPHAAWKEDEKNAQHIIQELHARIDRFFDDYQEPHGDAYRCYIKLNVSKFVLNLLGQTSDAPRYMYFHGPHGIGKTFFVHKLSEWLEELLPDSVRFEDMIISCADELEGNGQRPGALLRALRDQLKASKRASVIFMDEANWINNPGMESASKRTFNGEQSKLRTTYFGDGLDGSGISLDTPPMLIFVASNEEIKNPALKSRFDIIDYPLPNKDALAKHAHGVAKRSVLIDDADIPDKTKVKDWITDNKVDNFRQVEANVEQFVLS